jgi:hypothetical protein
VEIGQALLLLPWPESHKPESNQPVVLVSGNELALLVARIEPLDAKDL